MQVITICLEFNRAWMEQQKEKGRRPFEYIREQLSRENSALELREKSNTKCEITVDNPQMSSEIRTFLKEIILEEYQLHIEDGDYRLMTSVSRKEASESGTQPREREKRKTEKSRTGEAEKSSETGTRAKSESEQKSAETHREAPGREEKQEPAQEVKEEQRPEKKQRMSRLAAHKALHRDAMDEFLEEYAKVISKAKKCGKEGMVWLPSLLLSMDEGWGITTSLEKLADLLEEQGIVKCKNPNQRIREFIISDNPKDEENGWKKAVSMVRDIWEMADNSKSYSSVICFDISDYRRQVGSDEFRKILFTLSKYQNRFLYVFRIPYIEDIALNSIYQEISDIFFLRKVVVPPADNKCQILYAEDRIVERGFSMEEDLSDLLEKVIALEKADCRFHGYKTIDKVVDGILYRKLLCQDDENDMCVRRSDVESCFENAVDELEDPREALARLIGMEDVKKTIEEIIAQIRMHREMCASGHKMDAPCMHMRFVGSPGTGKTTVARLLAEIFKREGILKKGYFYEIKARDLCGRYVGETAPKTSRYCNDALGSILFIDEAYTLYNDEKQDSFGREALDTLVTEMENNRDNLIVIMAGYPEKMEEMLEANPGLAGRMPYTVTFSNYSREELIDIFYLMLDNCFVYDDAFDMELRKFFNSISESVLEDKNFCNARMVRNLYERIWSKAAYRRKISGDSEMRLLKEDIIQATNDEDFRKYLTGSRTKTIGF